MLLVPGLEVSPSDPPIGLLDTHRPTSLSLFLLLPHVPAVPTVCS